MSTVFGEKKKLKMNKSWLQSEYKFPDRKITIFANLWYKFCCTTSCTTKVGRSSKKRRLVESISSVSPLCVGPPVQRSGYLLM